MPNESTTGDYKYTFKVSADVIDRNGHVNNVAYVRWMQDAAVEHARDVIPDAIYRKLQCTWVARSHHIEYLLPTFESETIEVRTWLSNCKRVRCNRQYEFLRIDDQKIVARGETVWVLVRLQDGRPHAIPQKIRDAFLMD